MLSKYKTYPLGNFIEQIRGVSYKKSDVSEVPKEGYIPLLRANNIQAGKLVFSDVIYVKKELVRDSQLIKKGDIVIAASSGSKEVVGKSGQAHSDYDCSFGAFCKLIRAKENINPRFLGYFFKTDYYSSSISNSVNGANINNLRNEHIDNLLIPIPSVSTQEKIANVLDKAQELIDKRKAQIEALDQLTQSVFLEMFGDPIKNTNQYKKEKLANLCIKITDGTHHSPPTVKEGIPYITAKHLNKGGLDFFKDPTYVSLEDHQKIYERCNPEKGDVLYIKDGATTGIAAINHYDFEFSMLSSLALIKVDFNKLNNYYLTHFLNNERVFRKITSGMNGGAIKRLTLKKINNIEVVVPPIELQNQFAEIIKKIEIQKELLQKSLEELENNFNSLMQRVFKGELFND